MIDTYAVAGTAVTSGRVLGAVAALIALAGVIVAAVAVIRRRPGSRGPGLAWAAGVIGIVVGAFVVGTADGGPGTGNGIVGGFAAIVLGVLAIALGTVAHRSHAHVPTSERFRS
ncbi:DUF6223 family protein [Actinoplanes utahensis]|uniref:Uncharacterized protein n=1 Tax=Actinoplanes utahensis TaxID=1869 RepID=A0A0A6ULB2_ACTUT|nr:DUF6223 family protein [Actinoplanes utahensis]KHD75109.1 hypothetical protein MB27_24595 [Actinoplanes utahensis]GIF27043.1 hypothetical protein Aut01nite_00290 [Actinoplanes utahensis]